MSVALRGNKSGFSLVEVLVVVFIFSIVMGSLVMVFNASHISDAITSTKIELQLEVRRAMDWIIKDVRRAIAQDMALENNSPSTSHLKFNLWEWDETNNNWKYTQYYIEYIYDEGNQKIKRILKQNDTPIQTWEFNNIVEPPFYTTYNETIKRFDRQELLNDRKLIIVIAGGKKTEFRGYNVEFILKSEVKIRNG